MIGLNAASRREQLASSNFTTWESGESIQANVMGEWVPAVYRGHNPDDPNQVFIEVDDQTQAVAPDQIQKRHSAQVPLARITAASTLFVKMI